MFPEPEASNSQNVSKSAGALKLARRKYRKRAQELYYKKLKLKREKQRFANTMSSWAENFTSAATWQLQYQVAHWKATARALRYENDMLRSMLRERRDQGTASRSVTEEFNAAPVWRSAPTQGGWGAAQDAGGGEEEEEQEVNEGQEEEEQQTDSETLQISEEFIEFLKSNSEFRKNREERLQRRQAEEEMSTIPPEQCPDNPADKIEEYKKLYGTKWEKIAALEKSLDDQFKSACDKNEPVLWPIIPLKIVF